MLPIWLSLCHEDELIEVTRGYGEDEEGNAIEAPEDYLESFNTFIT